MSGARQCIPIVVEGKGLNYNVRQKKTRTTMLDDVHLCAQPKQLLAIMGPSGSGKTTLLNALANRVRVGRDHELKGEVLFNGKPSVGLVSKFSNYVMQEDHLMPYVTVYETIETAAGLKLSWMSKKELQERVECVINQLELDDCRNSLIGDEMLDSLTGGQKKRVSIAIELLDEPSVLFLDEPTSGLESSLAHDVVRVLVNLARGGRTVVCTIHQPRSQVFALFDQLLLLDRGRVVYNGPARDTTKYFSELGFPCPPQFNPADFFLDLLANTTSEDSTYKTFPTMSDRTSDPLVMEMINDSQGPKTSQCCKRDQESPVSDVPRFDKFAIEAGPKNLPNQIGSFDDSATPEGQQPKLVQPPIGAMQAWLHSFVVLASRFWWNSIRNPMESIGQLIINFTFGIVVGGLFYNLDEGGLATNDFFSNASSFAGCLFFVLTQYSFSQLDSLSSLSKERPLFNRETASGLYSPSAYYMAQNVAKFPFQQIPPLLFATIVYWMAGLGPTALQFFQHLMLASLAVFASVGYCYMLAAAIPRFEVANVIASTGLVILMTLSGYLLRDDQLPAWIGWSRYTSFMRYAFLGFCKTQFPLGETFGSLIPNATVLRYLGVQGTQSVWLAMVCLFASGLSMRLIGFLLLTSTHRKYGIKS